MTKGNLLFLRLLIMTAVAVAAGAASCEYLLASRHTYLAPPPPTATLLSCLFYIFTRKIIIHIVSTKHNGQIPYIDII